MIKVHFLIEVPVQGEIMRIEMSEEKEDKLAYELVRLKLLGEITGMSLRFSTADGEVIPVEVKPEHIKDVWLETV